MELIFVVLISGILSGLLVLVIAISIAYAIDKNWDKIAIFFWKIGYFFSWGCRLYPARSKVYRYTKHRKYEDIILTLKTPEQISEAFKALEWRKDGPRELWDAIGSPQWVQYCLDEITLGRGQPEGALDCDEFGCYAAVTMYDYQADVLNVFWRGKEKAVGHHVCIFKKDGMYYHHGNWGLSKKYFKTVAGVVNDIRIRGGGRKARLIGWAMFTPHELKVLGWGTRLLQANKMDMLWED